MRTAFRLKKTPSEGKLPSVYHNFRQSVQEDALNYYSEGNIKDFYSVTEIVVGKGSYATVKLGFQLQSDTNADLK